MLKDELAKELSDICQAATLSDKASRIDRLH